MNGNPRASTPGPTHSDTHYLQSDRSYTTDSFHQGASDSLPITSVTGKPLTRGAGARQLTKRDRAILGSLYLQRLLRTDQIKRLYFEAGAPSSRLRRAQARLGMLAGEGLVVRLDRKIGKTRRANVYSLSGRGMAALGVAGQHGKRRRALWPGKHYFQDHTLAVAETYVRLVEACREGTAELLGFDTEPRVWRRFLGVGGQTLVLKPDGLARVGTGPYELHSFVEIDMGTESLPTVQRKCEMYIRYCRSGLEQQTRGVFPRVVWLVPHEQRLEGIAKVLARLKHQEAAQLFTVALAEHGPAVLTTPSEGSGGTS